MADSFHLGQRLSYTHALCTVRYIGPIAGTAGTWLGVEWDDPLRGKHSGTHNDVAYFTCLVPGSGSFIRPTRKPDDGTSFLEALKKKYGDGTGDTVAWEGGKRRPIALTANKVFEEVGFEKIAEHWAKLKELRAVLLDGWGVEKCDAAEEIRKTCPNIEELDISRNRFSDMAQIARICAGLPHLRMLRINGNRFSSVSLPEFPDAISPFANVTHLELSNTLLTWPQISALVTSTAFPALQTLSLTYNSISHVPEASDAPLLPETITILDLGNNVFPTLATLAPLAATLPKLTHLALSHNSITTLSLPSQSTTFPSLHRLDISYNAVSSFQELDHLLTHFPALQSLRISHNPMFNGLRIEDAFMLTVARLARTVHVLNYSNITVKEREDAEMWYLGKVAREVADAVGDAGVGEQEAEVERVKLEVVGRHARWGELCQLHGEPAIPLSSSASATSANTLAAQLLSLEFAHNDSTISKRLPSSIPVSTVRRLVARWFGIQQALGVVLRCELGGHGTDEDEAGDRNSNSNGNTVDGVDAEDNVESGNVTGTDTPSGEVSTATLVGGTGDGGTDPSLLLHGEEEEYTAPTAANGAVVLADLDDTRELGVVLEDVTSGTGSVRIVVEGF